MRTQSGRGVTGVSVERVPGREPEDSAVAAGGYSVTTPAGAALFGRADYPVYIFIYILIRGTENRYNNNNNNTEGSDNDLVSR